MKLPATCPIYEEMPKVRPQPEGKPIAALQKFDVLAMRHYANRQVRYLMATEEKKDGA
jgi:hypothetical protein